MIKQKTLQVVMPLLFCCSAFANPLTVEELRLDSASKAMSKVISTFTSEIDDFNKQWQSSTNYEQAKLVVFEHSSKLWRNARVQLQASKEPDDRSLYWARLLASKTMRSQMPDFTLSAEQLDALLALFEEGSRGRMDLEYTQGTDKKILLTGFDPFLLDRNINQSNPSGIAALLLDGQVIEHNGVSAEINTVMVPVRYADFDQGIIETLLAPYYALNNVDLVVTVSMGREQFDLEHYPGKRRSVTAPDNLNILSGGTQELPVVSKLHNRPLPGEEFVLFSLPVKQMQQAKGPYQINDNRNIMSIDASGEGKKHAPLSLSQLNGHIAVSGSGGGYLSNEISYRSIRLRDQLNSTIPTGHIHTPRIMQFEPEAEAKIVQQIKAMLEQAITAI